MANTLAQLRLRFQEMSHRDDISNTDTELFFLNSSMKMLERLGYFRGQDTNAVLTSPSIGAGTISQLSINLPSRFRQYEDIVQLSPSFNPGLSVISREKANILYRSAESMADDLFQAVVISNSSIDFYPWYSATEAYADSYFQYKLYYKEWLADLANDTDSNYFTDNAADIIVNTALSLMCLMEKDMEKASYFLQIAQKLGNQFVLSEYGGEKSGTMVTLGDLEKVLSSMASTELGGSS